MPSLSRSAFKGLNVLITSGPTSVPIDDMRVITNRSSGEMGRLLATQFQKNGAKVTLLEGGVRTTVPLPSGILKRPFYFFEELAQLLKDELRHHYDLIIHAAAVSDFALKKVTKGKLSSNNKMTLELKPTVKLINQIRRAAPGTRLVGFKFEPDINRPAAIAKAEHLLKSVDCTCVVLNQNDQSGYKALLLKADGSRTKEVSSKMSIINLLLKTL